MNDLSVIDLFSSAAGGWSLGMHRAGFHTVAACEVIPWRRALYAENNPDVRLYDDVCTLTADRLLNDLGALPRILVGSPPCQDISSANTKGKGVDGSQSRLFFEAVRLVGEINPDWCALENSDRVRTRGYDRIAAELEALGYTLWPFVVGVGNAGASHKRKRAWIIGLGANATCAQGRLAGQPRVDAYADRAGRSDWRSGVGRRGLARSQAGGGARGAVGPDAHGQQLRIERGIGSGRPAVGKEAIIAGLSRVFRGPVGSPDLGSHIRAYDGLSSGASEQCREAYGDSVSPQITEAIGRAILRTEAALAALCGREAA